jgi:peptidoglycan/LPS O-acetylase OafA/YrhL
MTASGPVTRASWRPEIQALRALAIAAVVTYHAWPGLLPGGQVGVDIFFVVSGYLITGMLLREHAATGGIRLGAFAVRRARRLLPSALLVLAACGVLTALVMPEEFRVQLVRELGASALSLQNWNLNLAGLAGAEPLADSPLRHYWSLSVEEQFYLVWPALLAALLALGRWRNGGLRVVIAAIVAITVASFLWNLHLTALDSSLAYFSTLARAWEFGVGAILATMPASTALAPGLRAVLSWVGLAAIAVVLVTPMDPATFPGAIVAVPVLATAAVIWAGDPEVRGSPTVMARLPAVAWLGGISYALYLWHWPLIAFTPFITGQPSPWWLVALLIGLSVVLAWLTTRFVEQPIRAAVRPTREPEIATRPATS